MVHNIKNINLTRQKNPKQIEVVLRTLRFHSHEYFDL